MRCRLLLLMCAVSVCQSICHTGSFGAAFAKSLLPLVCSSIVIRCLRVFGGCVSQLVRTCYGYVVLTWGRVDCNSFVSRLRRWSEALCVQFDVKPCIWYSVLQTAFSHVMMSAVCAFIIELLCCVASRNDGILPSDCCPCVTGKTFVVSPIKVFVLLIIVGDASRPYFGH